MWSCCDDLQVIEDLREECSKYGQVMKVVVPRPPIPQQAHALFNQQNYGKVSPVVKFFGGFTNCECSDRPMLNDYSMIASQACMIFNECGSIVTVFWQFTIRYFSLTPCLYLQAFALFANPLSAQAAKDAIHGRLFAGSTVEVNYITAQQFGAVGGFQ